MELEEEDSDKVMQERRRGRDDGVQEKAEECNGKEGSRGKIFRKEMGWDEVVISYDILGLNWY